ncbi:MAG TPA: hypothetical protein VMG10_32725 [Gemmataceae bacterium]|nr:hypothetical protein [Gemmataceae bacterium]
MSGTKRLALRRPKLQKANVSGWLPLAVVLSFALAAPVQAQPLPLPAEEQDAINDAILRGVDYLKRTQQPSGTWAKPGAGHQLGYAVLPALTLLESGVPPSDPIIRQAARYVRARALKIDRTYELSLSILFLDRLGDRKDKKIIQAFALRLIAGQSMTGGWGYKCPNLPGPTQMDLLVALRHLDPWPNGMPGNAGNPGGMPGLAGGAGKNPGDLDPLTRVPGAPSLRGTTGQSGTPSLSGSTSRGGGNESSSRSGGFVVGSFGEALSPQELAPVPPSRWRDCLGLGILDGGDLQPLDGDPKARAGQKDPPAKPDGRAKAERPKLKKRFVIPERLRRLTVFQDLPPLHIQVEDPPDKRHDLFLMTTDNSNTQLAILALWTAQRYDVPMHRTLNLIVRRFLTSQNLDGSWDYDYHFGGNVLGRSASSPAMTCVGLIGLAVGHGLAQPAAAGRLVQDPRILKGLSAVYRTIGKPSNPPMKMKPPMQNLYFLWSVERVAVLYNLPRIGDKSWYRWGAQVLVANQEAQGSWAGGGYPGSSSTVDTCLALLFLKRANLAKDLAAKLPFKAADLNHGIMEKQKPPPPLAMTKPTPKPPELSESITKTILPAKPSTQEAADNLITKPLSSPEGTASAGAAEADPGTSGSNTKWIVLSLLAFIFFAGGSVFVLFVARRRNEEEEEKPDKPKKRKNKRKKSPSTA